MRMTTQRHLTDSMPRAKSQSDRQAPSHPCRKKPSGRQKFLYTPDTVSSSNLLSHKKHKAHKTFEAGHLLTFLICALCAFLWLFKQTENVREVVGPDHVSLHRAPTIVAYDRAEGRLVSRHQYPNRRIFSTHVMLKVFP